MSYINPANLFLHFWTGNSSEAWGGSWAQYFIYDEEQHGFRAGKSVTTASIDLIETIVSTVDRGDSVTGVFIDFMAIDSVHHVELLNALDNIGITG